MVFYFFQDQRKVSWLGAALDKILDGNQRPGQLQVFVPVKPGHDASPQLHKRKGLGFEEVTDNLLLVGAFFNEPRSSEECLGGCFLVLEIGSGRQEAGQKTLGDFGTHEFFPMILDKAGKNFRKRGSSYVNVIDLSEIFIRTCVVDVHDRDLEKKVGVFFPQLPEVFQTLAAEDDEKIIFEFCRDEGKIPRVNRFFFRGDIYFKRIKFVFGSKINDFVARCAKGQNKIPRADDFLFCFIRIFQKIDSVFRRIIVEQNRFLPDVF